MSPYKSKAQSRYFHYLENQGKMPKKMVNEFDDSSDFEHMPEHYSDGGMVQGGNGSPYMDPKAAKDLSKGATERGTSLSEGWKNLKNEMKQVAGYSNGGMVPEDNYDYEMGHESEYDSSGEPHTEDDMEDEHPMEFMSRGGRVKRMARGGMVSHPSFVRALRKSM